MTFKHLFSVPRFAVAVLGLSLFVVPTVTLAAPTSGALIKASGPSVYYFGENQKRYVFPTEKTYMSWYTDFSQVQTISDQELASYALGGNVTYRPGTRLVKITTDPKVYAVSRNGTLRWVETEAVAQTLFGTNWATRVDDIPDAFFTNYHIGDPIVSSGDYSITAELQNTLTINQDKVLVGSTSPIATPVTPSTTTTSTQPTPPSPASHTGTFDVSTHTPVAGTSIHLQGTALPSAGLQMIRIYFDGIPEASCAFSPCATDVTIPTNQTKPTYDVRAEFSWITGETAVATSTLTVSQAGNSVVTISATHPEIRPTSTREVVANVDTSFAAHYIDIYLDGGSIYNCTDTQQCRYSVTELSPVGTVHTFYAIATDSNGNTRQSATTTVTVVDNPHPIVTVATGKDTVHIGETVDVTVSGSDEDGINSTSIWLDGQSLKQCSAVSCTIIAGPWTQARTLSFVGHATDMLGLDASATSSVVTVQQ